LLLADWREDHGDSVALIVVAATVFVSGALAWFMGLSAQSAEQVYVTELFGMKLYLSAIGTASLLLGLVAGEVYLVFRLEKRGTGAESLVLFSFALMSGLLTLIFTKSFADAFFPATGVALMLVVSLGVFVSLYLTFLVLIGEYSEGIKNLLLVIFSATIGAFFSLVIPTDSLLAIVLIVVGVDTLLTYLRSKEESVTRPQSLSFTKEDWGIGLGDMIVFCLVTSSVLVSAGLDGYLASVTLLLAGLGAGMRIGRSGRFNLLPGTLLGALPAAAPILFTALVRFAVSL